MTVDEGVTCVNMSFDLPSAAITLEGAGSGATFDGTDPGRDRTMPGTNVGTTVIRNLTSRDSVTPAMRSAGAIEITGTSAPTLDGLEFHGNAAPLLGGAVRIQPSVGGPEPIVVIDSTFGATATGERNTGPVGGGLYVNAVNRPIEVRDSSFVGNTSSGAGGGPATARRSNRATASSATRSSARTPPRVSGPAARSGGRDRT